MPENVKLYSKGLIWSLASHWATCLNVQHWCHVGWCCSQCLRISDRPKPNSRQTKTCSGMQHYTLNTTVNFVRNQVLLWQLIGFIKHPLKKTNDSTTEMRKLGLTGCHSQDSLQWVQWFSSKFHSVDQRCYPCLGCANIKRHSKVIITNSLIARVWLYLSNHNARYSVEVVCCLLFYYVPLYTRPRTGNYENQHIHQFFIGAGCICICLNVCVCVGVNKY